MNMTPVESSQIHSVGYDPESKRLHVKFHSGGTYEYHGVEPATHDGLMKADSVGKFFHANVRNVHAHKKLEQQS